MSINIALQIDATEL